MADSWTIEFEMKPFDPKLMDLMFGRREPKHAAESTYYNDTLEAISKIKAQWPRDKGRHIKPGSWMLVQALYKDKPPAFKWSRHNGEPIIYIIDMDKLNA